MRDATSATIRKRLGAWANQHWPVLSVLGYTFSFVVLFGGVTLAVLESGWAHAAAAWCGQICRAAPGVEPATAAICGAGAILFVKLYAELTAVVQRVLVSRMPRAKRQDLEPDEVAGWVFGLYYLIGFYFAIGVTGGTILFGDGVWHVATTEFCLGWWAGVNVLEFFWPKPRLRPACSSNYPSLPQVDRRRTCNSV
jgi:hypothetical protein